METQIMQRYAADMAAALGAQVLFVEYGSGSSLKSRLLLNELGSDLVAYVPVDVSRSHLMNAAVDLTQQYPSLQILPLVADFTQQFQWPASLPRVAKRVVYFPGSKIGNFEAAEAHLLRRHIAQRVGSGGGLLIGIDLLKSRTILDAAYDDQAGVTAAFSLNLIRRFNRELGGTFRRTQFRHVAIFSDLRSRIEIYLESLQDQQVTLAGETISIRSQERIRTEYSHKYTVEGFAKVAERSGLCLKMQWLDDQNAFAVMYFTSVVKSVETISLCCRMRKTVKDQHLT
jgi:dimethylhistidine N-methyltransferase